MKTLHLWIVVAVMLAILLLRAAITAGQASPDNNKPSFTAAEIRRLRDQADELSRVPEDTPNGWSKSRLEPGKVVDVFRPLHLREGIALRAYQYMHDGNGNAVVWAMPADAEFPEPQDCPRLENHLFNAPKPYDALDDAMEAIEGDGSPRSYLFASLLRRELNEFGAMWHGANWSTHVVLDDAPWKIQARNDESPLDRPTSKPEEWKWYEAAPKTWAPQVSVEKDRVTVVFYTYSALAEQRSEEEVGKEGIYRHVDVYRAGKYRPRVERTKIAEGPNAIAF